MSNYIFNTVPLDVPKILTKNRTICTQLPNLTSLQTIEQIGRYESRSMQGQLPIMWESATDFSIFDGNGNKWIDFTSTIFVANVGHSNPRIIENIGRHLDNSLISTYAYANETRALYLKKLIDFIGKPFEKAFLLSSGTEAVEALIKLIRMNGLKISKKKKIIITVKGNWHGRTLGAQALSSNKYQKEWIGFSELGILHIDFPFPWIVSTEDSGVFFENQIKKLIEDNEIQSNEIAGIILETFQGWGALFYPIPFVEKIREFCNDNSSLLAFDEMQAGFGRTGKKFGFEHYGIYPDLIACGKGMGGGLPLSGVIGTKEILDLPDVGNMSSTHSANPICCAAGIAVIDEIISRNLVEECARKGEILSLGLNEIKKKYHNIIGYAFSKGLIGSIIFLESGKINGAEIASRVSEKSFYKGLLVVHTGRESIKIGPPLTISEDALNEGIQVLDESIGEILQQGL